MAVLLSSSSLFRVERRKSIEDDDDDDKVDKDDSTPTTTSPLTVAVCSIPTAAAAKAHAKKRRRRCRPPAPRSRSLLFIAMLCSYCGRHAREVSALRAACNRVYLGGFKHNSLLFSQTYGAATFESDCSNASNAMTNDIIEKCLAEVYDHVKLVPRSYSSH